MSHVGDIKPLLEFFSRAGITQFIETGTFVGETARVASALFERVDTIELDPMYYLTATRKFEGISNIYPILGDSRKCLAAAIALGGKEKRRLYWLDAHWWSLAAEKAMLDQCPLLDELKVINEMDAEACIMIDDASFYFRPPPKPYNAPQWPSLDRVFRAIDEQRRYVAIIGNVIVAVPANMEQKLLDLVIGL